MSTHYTRDEVFVVITSIASLGSIPYQKFRDLGIGGIYLWAPDNLATSTQRIYIVNQGFRCGLGYPADTRYQYGADVAKLISQRLASFLGLAGSPDSDNFNCPVLLDFEPSYGSTQFWKDFLWGTLSFSGVKGWRGSQGMNNGNGFRPQR